MKIRFLLALVGLAISLALPTFAQQKESTPSDKDRQAIAVSLDQSTEAWNNNDAVALVAIFTEDAVIVTDKGPIYGRAAIDKMYTDLFKRVHFSNHLNKGDQVSPHAIGDELWSNGEWSHTYQVKGGDPVQQKGYYSAIYSREGDTWKVRMLTWNVTPPPAK